MMRLHPDAVAALVSTDQIAEAELLTDELDASRHALELPWATAMTGRCRGLLQASAGDMTAATETLVQALADHGRLPMPFERARTELLLGKVLLRGGHRKDARRMLSQAHETFTALGTPVQAEQAERARSTIGGKEAMTAKLTAVEGRVAALAGAGQTNREVAQTLFMSVRTVESHLGRVYRKLGLRSRTELARSLPGQRPPHDE